MGGAIRPLLVCGNGKLSASIWHWDLPAIRTCPGRTPTCSESCYATQNRYLFPQVQERLAWNFEQSKRRDFSERLAGEIFRKGCIVVRWHVSGDVYSPAYCRKLLEVMQACPGTQFFAYTRSYRAPKIACILREWAKLENMRLWYSADRDCYPRPVPEGVRIAWMQVEEGEEPDHVDLLFRIRPLRKRIELPLVTTICPHETVEGRERGITCATCQICWK